ncbi:MAG: hypothetical protein RR011_00215 [Oscillospiraceae bacterium]
MHPLCLGIGTNRQARFVQATAHSTLGRCLNVVSVAAQRCFAPANGGATTLMS